MNHCKEEAAFFWLLWSHRILDSLDIGTLSGRECQKREAEIKPTCTIGY